MVAQNMLRTCEGKHVLSKMDFKLVTALSTNKCPNQIKLPISPYMYTPFSKLPSEISTMPTSER